ncbi:beta-lactamase [Oscillochloris trichoides DG-6]|uniref:Beta-lactamase n=1 Tax=Oscillochloris trichoides DG-6 TaxID=765420 RepID=E1IGH1_9CHLR|nr:serine hydrolase domain-containing protein [Oscillochloris trichoides]EFO79737.1 beta-lactamase [Oscillochloris trichoides DG-6]
MLPDTHTLTTAAETCRAAARMSGVLLAVAHADAPAQTIVLGSDAAEVTLAANALVPVASLTKLATALAILRLVDLGVLDLDANLAEYLPTAAAARPGVTLRRMLSHSAGLPVDVRPAWAPYQPGLTWPKLAAVCLAEPPVATPGSVVQYGNLGYGLAALVVEMTSGLPFSIALRDLVLDPLAIEGYLGHELPRPPALLADVRSNNPPSLAPFNSAFYRSLALPWAGLLTTVGGALALVRAFAGYPAGFLSPTLRSTALTNQTPGLAGGSIAPLWYAECPWAIGPELRGDKQPHWAPANVAPDSFGHAGASGAIAWHDPASQISYAIIGTRTAANGWLLRHAAQLGATVVGGA